MGQAAFAHFQKRKIDCAWLDLKDLDLPMCDANKCYGMPAAQKLNQTDDDAGRSENGVYSADQCEIRNHELNPVVATSSATIDSAAGLATMPMWSIPSMIRTVARLPTASG